MNAENDEAGGGLSEPLLQDEEQVEQVEEAHNESIDQPQQQELESPPTTQSRLQSVDALRGIVIAIMILVDDAGSAYNHTMDHSPWDHITLADFVMPFFLFVVGVSIRLSHRNYENRKTLIYHISMRSCRLFVLGFLLQGGKTDFPCAFDLKTARIPGILQRIAFCYFVTAISHVYLAQQSAWIQVGAPLVPLWTIYLLLVYFVPMHNAESCHNGADLSIPCNAARRVDEWIFGSSHMYQHPVYRRSVECSSCSPGDCGLADKPDWCDWPYDPEGALPSIAAVGSTLLGLPCGSWLQRLQVQASGRQIILLQFTSYGMALLLIGFFAPTPWNKNLYTLTYASFMAGCSVLSLLLCYVCMDMYRHPVGSAFGSYFCWLGINAILVFVFGASGVLDRILGSIYWGQPEHNLVDSTLTLFQFGLGQDTGLVCFALVKIVFWVLVCGWLNQKRLFFKI